VTHSDDEQLHGPVDDPESADTAELDSVGRPVDTEPAGDGPDAPVAEVAEVEHRIERRHRRRRLVAAAGALLVLLYVGYREYTDHEASDHANRLTAQVNGLSTAVDNARKQITQLGASPSVPPASKVRENPEQPVTTPQPVGPSDAQVRAAVAAYFAANPVTNNTPPDPAVVQKFVDAYLAAHPAPPGPSGSPGATGSTGATGATGAQGQKGDPGRGVSQVSCSDTHLVVGFDDGTTQDLGAGSCGQGAPAQPVHSYTETRPGPLGGSETYLCTWDGESTSEPHYDCQKQ
jgi:hypothetical protein